MSGAVPSLLHQGLVEFPAGPGMDSSPAIFTVILQTRHVSTEERGELAAAAGALTLVTQLIVQDIWLNFHLRPQNNINWSFSRAKSEFHTCVLAGQPAFMHTQDSP